MTALHGADVAGQVGDARASGGGTRAAPFITSTLQQEAGRKLHFTAKRTMMLAQQLYEGIELGAEGAVGLITYMRTDAVRVAAGGAGRGARVGDAAGSGAEYLPDAPPVYQAPRRARRRPTRRSARRSVAREPARAGALPDQGPARALPADLGALPRQPDAARRSTTRWPRTSRPAECLFRAQGSHPQVRRASPRCTRVARGDRRDAGGGGGGVLPPLDRGRGAQASLASTPSSTSPSRRRATPRPRW